MDAVIYALADRALSVLDRSVQQWEVLPNITPAPTAGMDLAIARLSSNKILIFGGWDSFTLWRFDPVTKTYTTRALPPVRMLQTALVRISGNKILMVGRQDQGTFYGTTYEFDDDSNSYTERASRPVTGASAVCCPLSGGRALVCGGWYGSSTGYRSDVHLYDRSTNSWTKKRDHPAVSSTGYSGYGSGSGVTLSGDRAFTVGGTGGNDWGETSKTIAVQLFEYDLTTDTWTQRASCSTPKREYAADVTDFDEIVAFGSGRIEYYDPNLNIWYVERVDFPTDWSSPLVACIGGNDFFVGAGYYVSQSTNNRYNQARKFTHINRDRTVGDLLKTIKSLAATR